MKPCRSCFKEIDDKATKCPYCQSFQGKWKGSQSLSLFFVLPFLAFSFWNLYKINGASFQDNKSLISISEISHINGGYIFEIDNRSDLKWTSPMVQIVFKDAQGKVVEELKMIPNMEWWFLQNQNQ